MKKILLGAFLLVSALSFSAGRKVPAGKIVMDQTTGIAYVQGEQGLFVAMPSRKMRNEEYKDIVHPICPDLRNYITKVVEEKYNSIDEETTVEIA